MNGFLDGELRVVARLGFVGSFLLEPFYNRGRIMAECQTPMDFIPISLTFGQAVPTSRVGEHSGRMVCCAGRCVEWQWLGARIVGCQGERLVADVVVAREHDVDGIVSVGLAIPEPW